MSPPIPSFSSTNHKYGSLIIEIPLKDILNDFKYAIAIGTREFTGKSRCHSILLSQINQNYYYKLKNEISTQTPNLLPKIDFENCELLKIYDSNSKAIRKYPISENKSYCPEELDFCVDALECFYTDFKIEFSDHSEKSCPKKYDKKCNKSRSEMMKEFLIKISMKLYELDDFKPYLSEKNYNDLKELL